MEIEETKELENSGVLLSASLAVGLLAGCQRNKRVPKEKESMKRSQSDMRDPLVG